LNRCDITVGGCSALAEVLSSEHSQLRDLELRNNSLEHSGVSQLSAGLKNPQCELTTLRLCECRVTAEGCAALTTALGENPSHLIELDLSGNNAGDSGIKQISNLLQNSHCVLETLRVSDNNIREEGYTALAEALKSSHLIELDLRGNDPGDSGVKLLTDLLHDPDCTLNTLRLLKTGAAQDGYDLLSRVLGENPLLQRELNVSEKIHGDSAVKQLSALLEDSHCRAQILRVNKVRMTAAGCAALTSALCLNPSHLRELELSENTLGGSGVKELCDVLKNPQIKLRRLGLCKCSLTEGGCADVVSALCLNPSHLQDLDLSENKIGDRGVKQLSDLLQNTNCSLEKLKLKGCSLTEAECTELTKALESNSSSHLMELDLRGNYSKSIWNMFRYLLGKSKSKLFVRILDNPEADKACDHLTKVLGTNPLLLTELDLRGKISGDSGVKQLSALLKEPHCRTETLRLSKSGITERGCTDLISALTANPTHLTQLDLSENTLGNAGVRQISTLLKSSSCKLQKLVLSDCSITGEGYTALVKALKSNRSSHLPELDLRGNDPGPSGLKELRTLMNHSNWKQKTWRLLKSPDAQRACDDLTGVLGINPTLQTHLNLSGKIDGDSGVERLCALLKDPHCRPETLQLSECNLTERGCSALLTALRSESSTLRELNLSKNRIQDSGVKLLSEELKNKHWKLQTVRLSDCSITEEGYTALAEALRLNTHVKELDLRGNKPGDSGVEKLTALLQDRYNNLQTLRLFKSPYAEEAHTLLTKLLGKNPLLQRDLDLSTRKPKDIGVNQLSALLQDPHYRPHTLTLYKEGSIKEDACATLISALVLNPSHLRELNLNGNKPGESGVRNLCDFLKNPKCKLQKLILCKSVSGKSCTDVVSALCTNPSHITELDLSECELGDSGVEKLCDLLKKHECKLETLRLLKCGITGKGCAALTEALRFNSHLKHLDLKGNELTESVVKQFEELLKRSGGEL
ncbi:protein NLRC5-like, partial [Clarias magur]